MLCRRAARFVLIARRQDCKLLLLSSLIWQLQLRYAKFSQLLVLLGSRHDSHEFCQVPDCSGGRLWSGDRLLRPLWFHALVWRIYSHHWSCNLICPHRKLHIFKTTLRHQSEGIVVVASQGKASKFALTLQTYAWLINHFPGFMGISNSVKRHSAWCDCKPIYTSDECFDTCMHRHSRCKY